MYFLFRQKSLHSGLVITGLKLTDTVFRSFTQCMIISRSHDPVTFTYHTESRKNKREPHRTKLRWLVFVKQTVYIHVDMYMLTRTTLLIPSKPRVMGESSIRTRHPLDMSSVILRHTVLRAWLCLIQTLY